MKQVYKSPRAEIWYANCLDVLSVMTANTIDTVITDPPYGFEFLSKGWDAGVPTQGYWSAILRVAKPGALLLAFGGTRTWHRLAVAIEDGGWQIRDSIMWLYGSGFPKSHNVALGIDKHCGAPNRGTAIPTASSITPAGKPLDSVNTHVPPYTSVFEESKPWEGYGTALKPSWEPCIVAMKPLDGTNAENALKWGVCGFNIDAGRIPAEEELKKQWNRKQSASQSGAVPVVGQKAVDLSGYAKDGRWPANILLDTDTATLLDKQVGEPVARFFYVSKANRTERSAGVVIGEQQLLSHDVREKPIENAYQRNNSQAMNFHPTVKPIDLMRYLCKLTKQPAGGIVLDPFMGSGTTGIAALLEGRKFIGMDITKEYAEIAAQRIGEADGIDSDSKWIEKKAAVAEEILMERFG